ncbi:unnamed protein product [Leptosia nina]|uniref:Elongation of very long chain fatty acids protein n=1 Tax=Leptosia nina TaxID=320188 RepID=A0AAV1JX46_9NEOP
MATLIWNIIKGYNYVFDEIGDPRTKVWPLVGKPHIGMSLLVLYLFFVMKWGPAWMKNRKPFDIERLLIVYNIVQVIICAYCFIGAVQIWVTEYKWICQPVDFSYSESGLRMAKFVYYYYLLKIVDLMDTVSIVLELIYQLNAN